MTPFFSIIIPAFNAGKTIAATLESVARQTYARFEVLVIDGLSSDDTLAILETYRLRCKCLRWISEKDDGVYHAMNKGVRLAKGDWIFFLGCDDTLYNDQVLEHVGCFLENSTKKQIVYGNVKLDKQIGYGGTSLIYDGEFDGDKLIRKNICHQAIFYHKSVFKRFGLFRTKYRIFADYDFNLRCFNAVAPLYLNETIANFSTDGMSNKQQELDPLFEADFLENMAIHYAYSYRHPYFEGRKKELVKILRHRLLKLNLKAPVRILPILAYQSLKRKHAETLL